ncbi:MAG: ADP-glyceromanno-heptose 6-epimerase [Selenomonadaceae bacterium]|nr:ADP-glyceromanno-heptose 6-epimerase [Selenomonadaceae bacterium]
MIILTGGAGFIGSCILRTLNDDGIDDIVVVDDIASTDKWKNLVNKRYRTYIHKTQFLAQLEHMPDVEAVIHMGAQSSTTERDFDYLWQNNFAFTKALWNYCATHQIPFIYASSAATYGDGNQGFDDKADIDALRPLNGYGYSKQIFDQWVKHQARTFPSQHVGLKFFNVYGPNEYFKGTMASMVFHGYRQICADGEIRLFKSENPKYPDGEQLRDFVYVKDICKVILWLLKHPAVSGLFNVGTGTARSFRMLAEATFRALGMQPNIHYIDMPEHLRAKYQYYTQADMSKLRAVGYTAPFADLTEGVTDYVQQHLDCGFAVY